MTEREIINEAELTPNEVENGFMYNGVMTTLSTLLGRPDTSDMSELELANYYANLAKKKKK